MLLLNRHDHSESNAFVAGIPKIPVPAVQELGQNAEQATALQKGDVEMLRCIQNL